jgi:protocatechuate 3,4-dioxygenase beta subunit
MRSFFLFAAILIANTGCTQNSTKKTSLDNIHVGGSCEGCEAIHESPIPFDSLKDHCWLPDWNDKGKRLAINGVVYKAGGTPAPNVIIYVYHTDQTGVYPKKGDETGWGNVMDIFVGG